MDDHIGKPVRLGDLFAKLAQWLDASADKGAGGTRNPAVPTAPAPVSPPLAGVGPPASTPPAPALDIAAALGRLGNNQALLAKLIGLFLQTETEAAQRIRRTLAAGETESGRRLAHTLKSTAATIGAIRLQAAARTVEQALRERGEAGEDLLAELQAAHAETIAGLESLDIANKHPR